MKRRLAVAIFVSWAVLSAFTQDHRCDEPAIREQVRNDSLELAPDVFYFTGAYEHPAIGRERVKQQSDQISADRKYQKPIQSQPRPFIIAQSKRVTRRCAIRRTQIANAAPPPGK